LLCLKACKLEPDDYQSIRSAVALSRSVEPITGIANYNWLSPYFHSTLAYTSAAAAVTQNKSDNSLGTSGKKGTERMARTNSPLRIRSIHSAVGTAPATLSFPRRPRSDADLSSGSLRPCRVAAHHHQPILCRHRRPRQARQTAAGQPVPIRFPVSIVCFNLFVVIEQHLYLCFTCTRPLAGREELII
jgi:hypothetical protein